MSFSDRVTDFSLSMAFRSLSLYLMVSYRFLRRGLEVRSFYMFYSWKKSRLSCSSTYFVSFWTILAILSCDSSEVILDCEEDLGEDCNLVIVDLRSPMELLNNSMVS